MKINGNEFEIEPFADLYGANLRSANLRSANLRSADLSGADLYGANLYGANLSGADLYGANLRSANLRSANLRSADLRSANLDDHALSQTFIVPEVGAFDAWKACRDGVLVRVRIPEDARRSNATERKCRAEFVDVISVEGPKGGKRNSGVSIHDSSVIYRVGERVTCDKWCADRFQECAGGIHFFLTRCEAENYY
jgi:uncharacterized protein YjbI with pentapeptide repeats